MEPKACLNKCLEQGTAENGMAVGMTKQRDNQTICLCSFDQNVRTEGKPNAIVPVELLLRKNYKRYRYTVQGIHVVVS